MPRGGDEDVGRGPGRRPRRSAKASAAVVATSVGRTSKATVPVDGREQAMQAAQGIARQIAGDVAPRTRGWPDRRGRGSCRAGRRRPARARPRPRTTPPVSLVSTSPDDADRQALGRAVGREHVDDVAEAVLAHAQPAVDARLEPPAQDVLAVVVARGQAQHLDDRPDRLGRSGSGSRGRCGCAWAGRTLGAGGMGAAVRSGTARRWRCPGGCSRR